MNLRRFKSFPSLSLSCYYAAKLVVFMITYPSISKFSQPLANSNSTNLLSPHNVSCQLRESMLRVARKSFGSNSKTVVVSGNMHVLFDMIADLGWYRPGKGADQITPGRRSSRNIHILRGRSILRQRRKDCSLARLQRMVIYDLFVTTPPKSATVHSRKNTREGDARYLASPTYCDTSRLRPVDPDTEDYVEHHCCT